MRRTLFLALFFASACKAQGSPEPAPSAAAPPPSVQAAGGSLHLGAPITQPLVALADIVKNPQAYENKVVATSGEVFAVCQSMGCWMEIRDASGQAHVKMAGHAFFVPKTSAGHKARVQAVVQKVDPNEECSQEAAEQTGKPLAKLQLEATGVELD
jgi:Domain of unknown function (DUF4920)